MTFDNTVNQLLKNAQIKHLNEENASPVRVAVIGGGPGGMGVSLELQKALGDRLDLTLYEGSGRLGGKVLTKQFQKAPLLYEAGVAELYHMVEDGTSDDLLNLVEELDLKPIWMGSQDVLFNNQFIHNHEELENVAGPEAGQSLLAFIKQGKSLRTPTQYANAGSLKDNGNPWINKKFSDVLDKLHPEASRYIVSSCHSDLATSPNRTTALFGFDNFLISEPDYAEIYAIEGGIEQLTKAMAQQIKGDIRLNTPIIRVGRVGERYAVYPRSGDPVLYDFVIIALPHNWLNQLTFEGALNQAMQIHLDKYNHPAHYLKVSCLFKQPFWEQLTDRSHFQFDAFGGCCVYDEGWRYPPGTYGGLSWLIAGKAALQLEEAPDNTIIKKALYSLPGKLGKAARALYLEGTVHRWLYTVNGLPAGRPVVEEKQRHQPSPDLHPGILLVGDYLYDSTINGALQSAKFTTGLLKEMVG